MSLGLGWAIPPLAVCPKAQTVQAGAEEYVRAHHPHLEGWEESHLTKLSSC